MEKSWVKHEEESSNEGTVEYWYRNHGKKDWEGGELGIEEALTWNWIRSNAEKALQQQKGNNQIN